MTAYESRVEQLVEVYAAAEGRYTHPGVIGRRDYYRSLRPGDRVWVAMQEFANPVQATVLCADTNGKNPTLEAFMRVGGEIPLVLDEPTPAGKADLSVVPFTAPWGAYPTSHEAAYAITKGHRLLREGKPNGMFAPTSPYAAKN